MGGAAQYVPKLIPIDPEGEPLRNAVLLAQAHRNPRSVPYTVEKLETLVKLLEGYCGDADSDPERDTYLEWLERRAREHGGTWAAAVEAREDELPTLQEPDKREDRSEALALFAARIAWQWIRRHVAAPFPVGKGCRELREGLPAAALRDLLPLEGNEHAFAVELHGERGGALLFMARPKARRFLDGAGWIGQEPAWMPDGARVVAAPVPQRSIPKATQRDARQWWREVNGLPVNAGRHPGAAIWTTEKVMDALLAYVQTHGGEKPSRETFVKWAYRREGLSLTEGSEKVVGDRWNRLLGMSFRDVRDSLANATAEVWTVEGEPG